MQGVHPLSISDELKAFLQGPVSVLVGTRDSRRVPEITRAWGPSVSSDRKSISLCVPLATSYKTLDNLEGNGAIAVIFALPTNYLSYQAKGRYLASGEPDVADLAMVDRHREAFVAVNEGLGLARRHIETLWKAETETAAALVKIRFVPEQLFDQTPGPRAGRGL